MDASRNDEKGRENKSDGFAFYASFGNSASFLERREIGFVADLTKTNWLQPIPPPQVKSLRSV
jgi:hypothetical protein